MAKNISLLGANYPDVPAVVLPKTGGGSAVFYDIDEILPVGAIFMTTSSSAPSKDTQLMAVFTGSQEQNQTLIYIKCGRIQTPSKMKI